METSHRRVTLRRMDFKKDNIFVILSNVAEPNQRPPTKTRFLETMPFFYEGIAFKFIF